jgi:intracellular multiplication protein IcmE
MNPDDPKNLSSQDPLNFDDDDAFLSAEDRLNTDDDEPKAISLADIWRNNPSLKIFAVVLVIGIFLIVFLVFGGEEEANLSTVKSASEVNQPPGTAQLPPAYEEAVRTASEQRATDAEITGGSALPTPIGVPERIEAPPSVENTDPLAEWRRAAEQRATERREQINITAPPPVEPVNITAPPQTAVVQQVAPTPPPPLPTAPDAQAVDQQTQRFVQQMQTVMEAQIPTQLTVVGIGIPTGFEIIKEETTAATATAAAQSQTAEQPVPRVIIPAGTIAYAQTLLEANSDVPGPVLAELASGPLSGARLIGMFQLSNEYLSLHFTRAIYKGREYAIDAYAIDPATTLPAMATDVNHHYVRRVLIPAAAKFLQGYAQAVSQRGSTVVVNNSSTIATQEPLDGREQAIYGTAEALNQVSQIAQQDAQKPITVKVASGTRMGLLFLNSVTDQVQNAAAVSSNQQPGQSANTFVTNNQNPPAAIPFNQGANGVNNNGTSTVIPVTTNSSIIR